MLKDDGVAHSLETVLNQVGVKVAVAVLIEILRVYLSDDKLDVELLAEFFRLTEFKDCFLEVMVGGENSYNYINIGSHLSLHSFDKILSIVAATCLHRWHFEVLADKFLIH